MGKIKDPHDKFFKRTMNDPNVAKDLIKNYLPEKVLDLIDIDTLEAEKDSFVEEKLKEYFSDLLYKVNLLGEEAYIYFLFEHKSYTYKKIALQLLKYMREIWDLKFEEGNKEKLPLIIPIVIYHGRSSWNVGWRLSDLLDEIPVELEEYIPDFKYLLYDFSPYNNEEIRGNIKARIFLEIMKYIFADNSQFIERLKEIIRLFDSLDNQKAVDYFETVIIYIMNVREEITDEDLIKVSNEISSEKGEKIMTIAEKLRKEGKIEGKMEGKIEGKIETAENLLKMGMEIKQIAKATKLDEDRIRRIKKKTQH